MGYFRLTFTGMGLMRAGRTVGHIRQVGQVRQVGHVGHVGREVFLFCRGYYGAGWGEAEDLSPEYLLPTARGDCLPAENLSLAYSPATVYNFEVDDAYDYFVSDEQVLEVPVLRKKCE